MAPQLSINISDYDYIVSHFDGNNNDRDDIAALPIAALLTNAADLQDKSIFAFNNNLNEPNQGNQPELMRESAAFAQKLGIETLDYDEDQQAATNRIVELFNSGKKVLSLEAGPMEMVYQAIAQTTPENRKNISLLSHSSWNDERAVGERPGGGKPRTWADIGTDFPEVKRLNIADQNGPDYAGPAGFYSRNWIWLDFTRDPILQEGRALMKKVLGQQVNDASDAGMHFFAITGNANGAPENVQTFLDANPVAPAPVKLDKVAPAAPGSPASPDVTPVFQTEQGKLIVEAESSELQGNWEEVTVAGRTVVLYDGPNRFASKPEGQTLSYEFVTDEAGTYDISLYGGRLHRAQSPGESLRSDLGNDVYVDVVDVETGALLVEATKQYISLGLSDGELRWGNTFDTAGQKSQARVELAADRQYRLQISGRSDGFILDRLTLSNEGRLREADLPQSPLVNGETSPPTTEPPSPQPGPIPQPAPQPAPPPGPSPATLRFEAEDFNLAGEYRPETIAIASGQSVISLIGGSTQGTGTASFEFTGASGRYDIKLAYFDESDGVARIQLNQSDATLLDFALDQQLGSVIAKEQTRASQELQGIEIKTGDRFELRGIEDGPSVSAEHVRIDYLDFTPVTDSNPNPTPEPPSPTPPTPPAPAPSAIRFEAESFGLSGEYRRESIDTASNQSVISLVGGSAEGTGSAAFAFTGVSGLYNIKVAYFDENDGIGQLKLNQGDSTLFDIALDQDLGSVLAKPSTSVIRELSEIRVEVGDRFELFAVEDGTAATAEHMRIDYLEFIPINTSLTGVIRDDSSNLGTSQTATDPLLKPSVSGQDPIPVGQGGEILVQRFL